MSEFHNVVSICRRLGPAQVNGRSALVCCPAHSNRRTPALSITQTAAGKLLYYCHSGCDFRDIVKALEGLGHTQDRPRRQDPYQDAIRASDFAAERRRKIASALNLWRQSVPAAGTPAETYLRSRAIVGPIPETLRFHPQAWHEPEHRALPAMVARVDLGGEPVAVHRTYLSADGRKAAIDSNKRMLGPTKGGAVHLTKGGARLLLGEGIETTLSAVAGIGEACGAWATLSTSGMIGVQLPSRPGDLIVAADADAAGQDAARTLAARAASLGWSVRIVTPPTGAKDWNDVACGSLAA